MFARHYGIRAVQALALTGVVLSAGGCAAKVKREDFNNEMARLREEIGSSDRQLGSRIDSTNGKVAEQAARIDALNKEFQTFQTEYKANIERVQSMLKFNVPVHFEFDRADVRDNDRALLDRFVAVVKQYYPGALVTVEGFTDPAGNTSYNKQLGQRRADAVKEYLATGGLDGATMKAVSYGEDRKRQVITGASGPGEAGMPNRRVVLVIDHEAVAKDGLALK